MTYSNFSPAAFLVRFTRIVVSIVWLNGFQFFRLHFSRLNKRLLLNIDQFSSKKRAYLQNFLREVYHLGHMQSETLIARAGLDSIK